MMWRVNSNLVATTIGLILLLTGSAWAQGDEDETNASLIGTFRFSAVKTCTDAVIGSTTHFYFNGTIIYDGRGSAKLAQQGTLILPGSTALSFEETADMNYRMKPDGSVVQEGTVIAGDHSYTITGVRMIGQIDLQGSIAILSSPIPPEQETVTTSGGGASRYFCSTSGTAVRVR